MRRIRVLGSALGLLAVGSACVSSTGGTGSSQFSSPPQISRMSRAQQTAWRDSVYAQAIADVEGPGASIRAEVSQLASTRRVRAVFELEADAYVVIGHIGPDGIMRIAFPLDPSRDDGFVKGRRQYSTHELLAGFADDYIFRAQQQGFFRATASSRVDSYDNGSGYLFMIASWRPMRFDRFATEDEWDTFELADSDYLNDPRPAIYELASLLVGENREAYTVKFARYGGTRSQYGGGMFQNAAFSTMQYCAGFRPVGFAFDPFSQGSMFNIPIGSYFGSSFGYGFSFMRRGVYYQYDSFSDCYRPSYGGFGAYGYRIALGPRLDPGNEPPKRPFNPEGQRTPFTPKLLSPSQAAITVGNGADARSDLPASPSYRMRGLITTDEPRVGAPGRERPRIDARAGLEDRSRPSIQEMVNRRPVPSTAESRVGAYSRPQADDRSRYSSPSDSRGSMADDRSSVRGSSYGSGSERYTPSSSGSGATSSSPPSSSSSGPASQGSGPAGSSSTGRPTP